jgi:uncharacterized protein YndB with AHSA1/START domain
LIADKYDLTAERMIHADVEDVFDAYTDPEAGRSVFAGGQNWVVDVTCDLNIGGVWSITSSPPGGAPYRETNHFTLIDRPRRLGFRSSLTMPDGSNIERDVEVTFKSEDAARTRMTILQKGFPNAEVRGAFGAGFPGIFDRLERVAQAWSVRREPRS